MITINDILKASEICPQTGQVFATADQAPETVPADQWAEGIQSAVKDGFLLQTRDVRGTSLFLAEPFAVVEGDLYRLTIGLRNEDESFVQGFSTSGFNSQTNGLVPRQVALWLNNSDIRHARSHATPYDWSHAMTMSTGFTATKTVTVTLHWNTPADTPQDHLDALQDSGFERAREMMSMGFVEGELHENLLKEDDDQEDGVDYRGWWKSKNTFDRQLPVVNEYAVAVTDKIRLFDRTAEVNPEFIDQAAEDGLSVIQAVQSWFADRHFDCTNLHPLTGSVEQYRIGIEHLRRPYIPISDKAFEDCLKGGDSDLYITLTGVVVTYGTADGGYALMPLNDEASKLVLDKHQESGEDA